MATELAVQQTVTPMTLIERAAAAGASIEQMQQLFDLKLRVDADNARTEFNDAMARFKENPPRITKNITKKAGTMDLLYASLDHVCDALIPALASVGIRHAWSMRQEDGKMTVTCTLTHKMGHSEGTSMSGPYDSSGSKNPIQAIASAQTYLQRYTLLAATGQAAGGTDDDAVSAESEPHESNIRDYMDAINAATNKEELKQVWEKADAFALSIKDLRVRKAFVDAKDRKKAGF